MCDSALTKLAEVLNVDCLTDYEINGCKIFEDAMEHVIESFIKVLHDIPSSEFAATIIFATNFAAEYECSDLIEYTYYIKFVLCYRCQQRKLLLEEDKENGAGGKLSKGAKKRADRKITQALSEPEGRVKIYQNFDDFLKEATKANLEKPRFGSHLSAMVHYLKYGRQFSKRPTPHDYLDKARKLIKYSVEHRTYTEDISLPTGIKRTYVRNDTMAVTFIPYGPDGKRLSEYEVIRTFFRCK